MSQSERNGTYVESTIIMTTVRIVVPFVFTFGLFVMFHGAESAGGGFQGGVIVASAVLLLAFAFGIEPTRGWLEGPLIRIGIAIGGATFASVGLGALVANGAFLEYAAYGFGTDGVKYGIELVELAIGAIVSGVLVSLFFSLARGDFETVSERNGGDVESNGDATDAAATGGERA
ncbi:MnhB domain-containing protein [Halobellus rarus]|uniref:MnhB domain-containing protein n=1 Tax=Halobellus rarus TaxID=1126237 RepID=A0ABD6CJS5_9EURY